MNFLIIEDDQLSRISLQRYLSTKGKVVTAATSVEAMELINKNIDIAFVDLDLESELLGLSLISQLSEKTKAHIIVLSGREEDSTVKEAYLKGAHDYLCKPFDRESLDAILNKFKFSHKNNMDRKFFKNGFITNSNKLKKEIKDIFNYSLADGSVLILGETGTGKTALVKLLHAAQGSAENSLVHLNCSGLNPNLLESELFGHEKGAFTGANETKKGKLELAHLGTLFLDEIATMPPSLQEKLLIALEEKSFYRVGGSTKITSDFRIISATCEPLIELIKDNKFRKDLYFRLAGKTIELPPLRERKEDVKSIINFLMKEYKRKVVVSEEAYKCLQQYNWPGNIRELRQVLKYIISSDAGIITREIVEETLSKFVFDLKELDDFQIDYSFLEEHGLKKLVERIENEVVKKYLNRNNSKVRKTLEILKISNSTFYKITERLKLSGGLNDL